MQPFYGSNLADQGVPARPPPYAAFGNSTCDQEMLEYTQAGEGTRLMMLVLHEDAQRE